MKSPKLYQGHWTRNVTKSTKYSVKFIDGEWRVTVVIKFKDQSRVLVVEGEDHNIPVLVNNIKNQYAGSEGGTFYINEYQQLIVPVKEQGTSFYYFGDKVQTDFRFVYEGETYTTRPIDKSGNKLEPGDEWNGPRPGIQYRLASGGADIYKKDVLFNVEDPPEIKKAASQKIYLLDEPGIDQAAAKETIKQVFEFRGLDGCRFYVNENRAIYTQMKDEEGPWNFIYCGDLNLNGWFPDPHSV